MKTEFEYNDKIIATADLEKILYVDDTVTIYDKEYVVFENYHNVKIDENGTHEKIVCTVVSEEEYEEWEK